MVCAEPGVLIETETGVESDDGSRDTMSEANVWWLGRSMLA